MSRQRMSADDRRQAIVTAALPLFAKKGFAETTTKDLAKAAGVSEPLLYKHFPSKEALYLEIQNYCCNSTDPYVRKLSELEPCTSSLIILLYYLMRSLILGKPASAIDWDTRHRLMANSFLEDGTFARLLYQNRFEQFCCKIEACMEAAIEAGDMVNTVVSKNNAARFAHHIGAWLALVHLPETPAMDYKVSRGELLQQAVAFALRGIGLTDKAIASHYNPKALALFFEEA